MNLDIEEILKLTQDELLDFSYVELQKRGYKNKNILYTENYLYALGEIPVLLVAHCDIVHKTIPQLIVNDRKQRILWCPTGIGGDDRCGVYSILKICEKYKPYVLLTTNEEVGGLGAKQFTKEIETIPVNFIVELDRKGNNEVVYYDCGNKEFQEYIESFGFKKNFGSYSDVNTLSNYYDIAGCNVSAGYYNQHTTTEFIVMDHLYNSINKVKAILEDTENYKKYDCQEIKYTYNYNDYWSDWYYDYDYSSKKYKKAKKKVKEIEENKVDYWLQKEEDYYSLTPEEWLKKYKVEKPENIIDIYY